MLLPRKSLFQISYNGLVKNIIKFVYQISSEIVLIFLFPIHALTVQFTPKEKLLGRGDGKTIVIVERWLALNFRHLYWKYYLEDRGYRVYLINFQLWYKDFSYSGKMLSEYMERLDLKSVTMVGISSGALTGLLYLQDHNGWARVDRFISVGTPFRGTWAALFLFFLISGWELLPISGFINRISKYKIDNIDKVFCIRAKFDEMVPNGAVLNGAQEVVINTFGHNNLHIKISATYRKIVEFAKY